MYNTPTTQYYVNDLTWLTQSMEWTREDYLKRIILHNEKNPNEQRPVERAWLDAEKFRAEWLPRAAFTWGITLGPENRDQQRHTFLKRIRPDKGFIRGNLIMTAPDACSAAMGPGYHFCKPHITNEGLKKDFNQLSLENAVPEIISKVVTQEEWDFAWAEAKKPSDPVFPTWDDVYPDQKKRKSAQTYHEAIIDAKVIGKDKFFSPTLAKQILDENPDLTPEELVDKVYEEVAKRIIQVETVDGKVEKKNWKIAIKQIADGYEVSVDLVTEIMVQNDGNIGKVMKHLGSYKTRGIPVFMWKKGRLITEFSSLKEASEVTGICPRTIASLRDSGKAHRDLGYQFTEIKEQPFAPDMDVTAIETGVKLWDSMKPMLRNAAASPIAQEAILSKLKGYSLEEISNIVDVNVEMLDVIIDTALSSINTISDAALRKKK